MKKKRNIVLCRIVSIIVMLTVFHVNVKAQADQLYLEGKKLAQVMTVKSQNAAIGKFEGAKVIYMRANKKKLCDKEISICRENIKKIKGREPKKPQKPEPSPVDPVVADSVAMPASDDVSLVLSKTTLDFKAYPKEGYTQTVEVKCNYDWKITEKPEWVNTFFSEDKTKINISVKDNESGDKRAGVVEITSHGKRATLIINQGKSSKLRKLTRKI
ncbi:MAG: BACON domain-containing protein [Prevotella sp.]|nr:BACON domain-containing protein [Prevotella sp.]